MKIDIIAVGKLKEKYFTLAVKEYQKRLSAFCKLNIIEVLDKATPQQSSQKEREEIKNNEGEKILAKLNPQSYVIALEINGEMLSSEELAKKLDKLAVTGSSHITFIIGGSLGLSQQVLKKAQLKLSFSPMTFPHQLMRVILLEQVYRSFKINRGEPYHK
ncbi:23S rRNA (pseudouridine(1915)-N(3))-methyltransferase RlmH [Proteinivorax hydrogeniformans]|uniref:Ribosomal RNA large subunit methyltransferase H n=1 Tax=Proteinivorax hydrogeniformans TaxID=1826727 RepID=A0AAU8HTL6_9FIRM